MQETCNSNASFNLTATQRAAALKELGDAVQLASTKIQSGTSLADAAMGGPGGINSADELADFRERAEMALKLLGGELGQKAA